LHDAKVAFSGEGVESAVAVGEQIENFRARLLIHQLNGIAQTAGGGVMAVTESGGQNEDFLLHGRGHVIENVLRPCGEQVKFYSHFAHRTETAI
jgi:hypothetical protein